MLGAVSLSLTYVGHATVLVELDGTVLVTDPMLRQRVIQLRRFADPPEPFEAEAVLISHGHYDHLDLPSLDRIGRDRVVVVPHGLRPLLRRRGYRNVVELEVGEETTVGSVRVRATRALHSGARLTAPRAKAVGYLILGSRTVYFAGDTDLMPELDAIGREGIDVALIPVWGWGPKVGAGHLDPERAAEAARRVHPTLAVPIHWGTYASRGGTTSREPAERFDRACAGRVPLRILEVGERLTLL
jgi:L-ascorbate metabolism protein UlaG (beta-lactamase superfamily)